MCIKLLVPLWNLNHLYLQTPVENLLTFTSGDAHHAPLLHLFLKESEGKPIDKLLAFLSEIGCLVDVSSKTCAHDLRAGKCYPSQAVRILCAASKSDHYLNIVKSLLQAETNVDGLQDGMTPLMYAAENGNTEILQKLIACKATVDFANQQQETSLLLACRCRQWQAAIMLFDHNASALHADINGQTPLHVAVINGGVKFVEYAISRHPAVFKKLKEISSLSDACQFHYDTFIDIFPCLSDEQIKEVVTQACMLRNTDILQHTGQRLGDDDLITHITQAYHTNHLDCLDALLKCAEGRIYLACPDISLTESCKRKELINLTEFLVTKGKDTSENNGEPLRTAAKSGNLSGVEYLIQTCHVDVDKPDIYGATALLCACLESHLEVVDLLLDFNANVDLCADETPLTAACKNGQQEIVNCLLQKNPDLNKTNKGNMTPVDVAINNGHTTVAVNLMKKGASLSLKTSFHSLCQLGDTKQLHTFLQNCTDCQIADEMLLKNVVKADDYKLLQLLLNSDKVRKSTKVLEKALETACMMGRKTIAGILMGWDHGNVWNNSKRKHESYLFQGIKHQHADIVELLMTKGCDLTVDSCSLEDLVKSNDILNLVVERMSQPLLNRALLLACSSEHRIPESCVRQLLARSADGDYYDPETHLTPLLAAVITPCETLVRILLEYGVDPNKINCEENIPLYLACDGGNHSIASRLLDNRNDDEEDPKYKRVPADPNPVDLSPEKCPLWISCLRGHLDLVSLLADNKANLNLQNEKESLLEASYKAGQHEVIRLLLEYGADPATLSTIDLKTACRYGYAEKALALSHDATMDELRVCISEACNEGYPETGMAIIINISDETKQKELFQVLQQESVPCPQASPTDDKSESEPQENDLWKYFYSKKSKEMMDLIKRRCDPNITNTHGITLFQACVQDKRIHTVHELCPHVDINQKDSVGRNVLFYVLKYLQGRPEQAGLFHLLMERGADMTITDNFGRTLLHEWNPQPSLHTRATAEDQHASKLDISLQSLMDHIPVDKADLKKQTPLHAAVMQENQYKARLLMKAGSSPTILDENKISPCILATRWYPDMHKVFTSDSQASEETKISSSDDVESASFSNAYHTSHRIPAALSKLFHKAKLQTSVQLFCETFELPLLISKDKAFKKEFKAFCETVCQFMKDLSDEIVNKDPLFAFKPVLSGSCSEGTKVGAMDEADVLCLFSHQDWKEFNVLNHEENNCTFMKLSCDKFAEKHPSLVRKSCLSVHGVFARFYGLIRKSLAQVLRKHDNLYIRDPHSILESTYGISALKLIWSGEVLQWQPFSLDVVPAILLTEDKIPKELNHYNLLHDIFAVPKWTASLIDAPYADEAFQLGFSFPEKDLFHAMPIALREGYKLAKVVVQKCMVIDSRPIDLYISSYMLKCQMFQCFTEMKDFADKMKNREKRELIDDKLQRPRFILAYADQILEKLEKSIKNHYQESFFLKGCNLLGHSMFREDFRPLLYMRLCRAMLQSPSDNKVPWECLAKAVAEQLVKEEHFKKESFIEEISMLKSMGLDTNWRSENGACLLYYMIKYGLENGVYTLIEWGATSDDIDKDRRSFIQVAESFKQSSLLKVLLEKGKCAGTFEKYGGIVVIIFIYLLWIVISMFKIVILFLVVVVVVVVKMKVQS